MDCSREQLVIKLRTDNLKHTMYTHRHVRVFLTDGKVLEGWIQCSEPLTGVLTIYDVICKEGSTIIKEMNFIRESYILRVDDINEINPDVKLILTKCYIPRDVLADNKRRNILYLCIRFLGLPVTLSADLQKIIFAETVIHPPYIPESCIGLNERYVESFINRCDERHISLDPIMWQFTSRLASVREESAGNESISQ